VVCEEAEPVGLPNTKDTKVHEGKSKERGAGPSKPGGQRTLASVIEPAERKMVSLYSFVFFVPFVLKAVDLIPD
jgi:hypothetical protein